MPKDTITFAVNGALSLERFAVAIRRFTDLVSALNREFEASGEIDWVLEDLEYGSAITTTRAVPKSDDLWPKVEEIIDSYLAVGQALEADTVVPFSSRVQNPAGRLKQLLNGDIESIRFETSEDDVTIERAPQPHPLPSRAWPYAFGAVEGRIQTLTKRGRLRFTLYDLSEERAVSCYLDDSLPNREEIMKDVWGKIAIVEGDIRRNPRSGRAQTIRRVRRVSILPEPVYGGYLDARGALKWSPRMISSEEAIRRVRDA